MTIFNGPTQLKFSQLVWSQLKDICTQFSIIGSLVDNVSHFLSMASESKDFLLSNLVVA